MLGFLFVSHPPPNSLVDDAVIDSPQELSFNGLRGSQNSISSSTKSHIASLSATTAFNDEYRLAYDQSFGFFTDYNEDQWKRAQEIHSKAFPNYYLGKDGDSLRGYQSEREHHGRIIPAGKASEYLEQYSNGPNDRGTGVAKLGQSKHWYAQNFQEEFHCPLAQRLPSNSQGDGPKWVCDPHRLRPKDDCLVYSFGSNGKAEFEKGVKDEIGTNCEIHTFDMKSNNTWNGEFDKALEGYATFHHWGLGTKRQAKRQPHKYKTLSQTMKELGHENRTIDIFKIDCEWCEWFTFEQWLQQDIRQILVETHNAPMPQAQNFFFDLHDAGYVIFNKEANYANSGGGVEYGFIKLSQDFFVEESMYNMHKTAK